MTYPAWPTVLGPPNRDGYEHAFGDGRRRSRPDAGPGLVGRRVPAAPDIVTLSFPFNPSQLEIFKAWYRDNTRGGSALFTMPSWQVDGWPLLDEDGAVIVDEAGVPVLASETWLVRFGDRVPVVRAGRGTTSTVSFDIEVMP